MYSSPPPPPPRLSAPLGGKPLYAHIVAFLELEKEATRKGETSWMKQTMLDTLKKDGTKLEHLGLVFSTVVYPIVSLFGEAARADSEDRTFNWITNLFQSLAFALYTVKPTAPDLAVEGKAAVYGNGLL